MGRIEGEVSSDLRGSPKKRYFLVFFVCTVLRRHTDLSTFIADRDFSPLCYTTRLSNCYSKKNEFQAVLGHPLSDESKQPWTNLKKNPKMKKSKKNLKFLRNIRQRLCFHGGEGPVFVPDTLRAAQFGIEFL